MLQSGQMQHSLPGCLSCANQGRVARDVAVGAAHKVLKAAPLIWLYMQHVQQA
jgi:hypothetical protein